jgi:hypothetical protein
MASTTANAAALAGAADLKGRVLDGDGFAKTPPREGGAPSDGSALGQRQRLASRLASSEAFEFRLGEIDGLLDRFALLRAYGDHFEDRALCGHLRADAGRRRITGKQGRHILARRVIVEGTLGGCSSVQVLKSRSFS